MLFKLKALILGLLATAVVSSAAAIDAAASGEGHFVTEITHAKIIGSVGEFQKLHFSLHGIAGEVGCDDMTHTATMISASKTATELVVTPGYGKCYTTGGEPESAFVHVNGCTYKFTVAKGTTDTTEQTLHLQCPPAAAIKITHPNCTITIHPQNVNTGITYTKGVAGTKHHIVLHLNAEVTVTRHGLCQLMGTFAQGTIKGAMYVRSWEPGVGGKEQNLTAT
jgi:hypothetical protein